MLKLLYMTTAARSNRSLIKHLQSSRMIELCGIIEETPGRTIRVNQLFRKKGFFKKIDLAAFRFLHRFIPDSSAYEVSNSSITGIPRLSVSNVNDQKVIALIRQQAPDLIILKGVSIVTKDLIEATAAKMVNIHSGWLPDYRGVQCGTWPLVKGEFDKIGITFHHVDEGLDTGKIILREKIGQEALIKAGLLTLHHEIGFQQHRLIVENLDQFLSAYRENSASVNQPATGPSKSYSYICLTDFIQAMLNLNRYKKRKKQKISSQ